jgi:HEAT repeat protein
LEAQVLTFEETVAGLNDPDPDVRRRALRLLGDARFPEAAEPISALFADPETALRVEAMRTVTGLFLLEPPDTRRRVGLVFEQRGRMPAQTIFDVGPLAVGPHPVPELVLARLGEATLDGDEQVAIEAVYTLGVLGRSSAFSTTWRPQAAGNLTTVLQRNDRMLRLAALRAIGRIFAVPRGRQHDVEIGDAVVHAMNDRERQVRVSAIEALGLLRHERALQALMERHAGLRRGEEADAALQALARIGHPSASPVFLDQLATGTADRKRIAIEGLARTGPPDVLGDIQTGLGRDNNRALSLAAAFAAARLANGPVDPILGAARQAEFEVQAMEYLADLVRTKPAAFVPYGRDPDDDLRAKLAEAVALSDDAAALPVAEALSRDPIPSVADAAARAVSWLELRR